MDLRRKLSEYQPFNQQEEKDKPELLRLLDQGDDVFNRDNNAHFTASAWLINQDGTKALMAYHNIYDSYSWLGGHADGNKDLLQVAMQEACQESGLKEVEPVTGEIFSIEILTVDGHIKKGKYVSSHLHYNVTFLLRADDRQALKNKPDENSDVKWFTLDDAVKASSEPWFREHIYKKLNAKVREMGYGK